MIMPSLPLFFLIGGAKALNELATAHLLQYYYII